jgi:hypothetical protein
MVTGSSRSGIPISFKRLIKHVTYFNTVLRAMSTASADNWAQTVCPFDPQAIGPLAIFIT